MCLTFAGLHKETKNLLPINGYFSLIASPILEGMSSSESVLTILTNPYKKILSWLIDKFSSSLSSPICIGANSNGLDCFGAVF